MFSDERKNNIAMKERLAALEHEHDELKQLSHKRYLEIVDYEQKYRGIDISKLHE